MRYLGSKVKLLEQIESVIDKNNIEGETFADLFAGTGCVGDYFKSRYKIISNDFLYYSYVFNKAKLMNAGIPQFKCFNKKYCKNIFEWLNSREYVPDDTYFVYKNYTPIGNRMFFTEKNGIKIDGVRKTIESLYGDGVLEEKEYFFLVASLLESVTKVSNTSGTYEAYFKFWDSRAEKDFILEPLELNSVDELKENVVLCEDVNKLVRNSYNEILRYYYPGVDNIYNALILPGEKDSELHFALNSAYSGSRIMGNKIIEHYLAPKKIMEDYMGY